MPDSPAILETPEAYIINGRSYARASAVVKLLANQPLEDWKAEIGLIKAEEVSSASQKVGTTLHKMIELELTGQPVKMSTSPKVKSAWQGYQLWKQLRKPTPVAVESLCWSETLNYATRPDLWEADIVTDWKVTSRLTFTHLLKANAACPLIALQTKRVISTVRLVRFDPYLADYEERCFAYSDRLQSIFQDLVSIYRELEQIKEYGLHGKEVLNG